MDHLEKLLITKKSYNLKTAKKVAFMGVLRGTNIVYNWAKSNNKDFYYIDRPYWGESRGTPYWMRCVKNEHVKTFVDHRPDDIYKKYYKGLVYQSNLSVLYQNKLKLHRYLLLKM